MKVVVLDHPRIASLDHFNDIAATPLWSCLLARSVAASLAAAGAEVVRFDHTSALDSFAKSGAMILKESPELLAINGVYFWEHTRELFTWLENLRGQGFQGHICLFGFFPSLVYEDILAEYPGVDSVSVGECELTLVALWRALGGDGRLSDISGLATRAADSGLHYQDRQVEKNPDNFPFPLPLLPDEGVVTILASRGCYNRCSFCLVPPFDPLHGGWRGRSPENIAEEVRWYVEKGYRDFYFSDPNFIGPGKKGRARTSRLLALLKELDITFGMETRPNDLTDDLVAAMVDAGLTSLLLGVESGSSALLGRISKHSSAATAASAISLCRKYGLDPEIGFLMFLPDMGVEELRTNFLFLQENELLTRLDRTANLFCHRQIVLRGTSGYEDYRQHGRLQPKGIFGFEGIVPFAHPAVAHFAEAVIHACHSVLRSMSADCSPIYWRNPNPACCEEVNSYLVALFADSLEALELGWSIRTAQDIDRELNDILQTSGNRLQEGN